MIKIEKFDNFYLKMGNYLGVQIFDCTSQNVMYNSKTNRLHLPNGSITEQVVSKSVDDGWLHTFITADGNTYKCLAPTHFYQ